MRNLKEEFSRAGQPLLDAFHGGRALVAHNHLGAHFSREDGTDGVRFTVYAPYAVRIAVIGDFNAWNENAHILHKIDNLGVFSVFVPGACRGQLYKYRIWQVGGNVCDKSDPYAFMGQRRPYNSSVIMDIDESEFHDEEWLRTRSRCFERPLNIYEVHLGAWCRKQWGGSDQSWYTYDEIAERLADYALENGFTHIEIMPLTEHPFDGSWGYHVSGMFAATSRYGSPQQLIRLIDVCHSKGIGVILDFVMVHFVRDSFGLGRFDGTPLYEYPLDFMANSEWDSYNYDFYKGEVQSFLLSSAYFWLSTYHFDGLRIDAASNIIYWQGQPERGVNQGAVEFIRRFNDTLHEVLPEVMLIAEDSSSYYNVTSRYADHWHLGFDYKWDMGWMNDTLKYFSLDPFFRRGSHNKITFSMDYYQAENYLLPFSHDESSHGKKSILGKMWGTTQQKFAQCRALYVYMFTHPGKKLNFMGNEFAQLDEWKITEELHWYDLQNEYNAKFYAFFREMSRIYRWYPSLWEMDYNGIGFEWIDPTDDYNNLFTYIRRGGGQEVVVALNLSTNPQYRYILGLKHQGMIEELLCTDDVAYGGDGLTHNPPQTVSPYPHKDFPCSVTVQLAPLSAHIFLLKENPDEADTEEKKVDSNEE
ncbi:MAG: 1,4-alpha-glucan branching protein GlgB [Clostridia bacterium]|nr:1,4-alpha-glucan branching protein GlgB [Clostridia bacterium]